MLNLFTNQVLSVETKRVTYSVFVFFKAQSRDIYHTKRMQRLTTVLWSLDNKFILSASDEMNIRIWKANASEKLGAVSAFSCIYFNFPLSRRFNFEF